MQLHWHRRDLRASDNRALGEAAAAGSVVPVFVFDDDVLRFASDNRVAFLLGALSSLRAWYRDRGGDLVVARGAPTRVLPALAAEHGATRVTWNRDYSGLARRRDEAVREALSGAGVETAAVHDAVLHEPGSVTTNEGDPYAVFSYFWRKWRDRPKAAPVSAPTRERLAAVSSEPLPTLSELGFESPDATIQDAGVEAARERLLSFCDDDVYRYADDRDVPTREGTSRLSADLRFGTVGIREVYAETEAARGVAPDEAARESVTEFQRQLAWREFYAQVLWATPAVVSENYREYERGIEWRTDPEGLAAWKRGETGYPIVDAGMRQLLAEGYLHNRVRMLVASFLTKDLLVDWRAGYAHFREHLVDHDPANDAGGWQWAASTGTDAQPYFRVFNPMTQGERYDPDATYIRRYVPELRGVEPSVVHGWHELDPARRGDLAPEYPAPIVDHAERREAALSMFERARGGE